ncbi:uncharacterized protein FIESC28_07237 [Fusarium coffeatum]|uniref:LysM domain-containing protein n=1 Tax=Fusarium coffeatum TaxID=231269 RepID=A0A366RGQ8_9HYPO|nr:uncharacterized protein FIESC28_07237 [Fusarium coffeatum]RBR15596.1 hypothetical protein FIESC28_07237 [Fusarium coffeatum]
MHCTALLLQGLLAVGATALRGQRIRRQDGTIDPGQPSDCTWWIIREEEYQDCAYLEDYWNLKHSQFVEYNPTVKDDCSGMQFGHSYCVEVNNGLPRKEESASSKTTTPVSMAEPTKTHQASQASQTQDGLIDTCVSFYQAKKGDTCPKIIAEHNNTFDKDDLVKWNPAIQEDCSGIWANYYYCVGVPGTPTSPPTRTQEATIKPTSPSKPSPTQDGLISSCTRFHQAKKGETCTNIISTFGTFDFDTFYEWNPAVGEECSGIWANYYYCVGIPGTPNTKPSVTTVKPTATGFPTPSPILDRTVKGCTKFHLVSKTTTCPSIEKYYNLPFPQFLAWNPEVKSDCSGLWANYYVCVMVEGYKPVTTTATTPANGIQTPSPIQTNMVKNCEKFHQIKPTTTCSSIEKYYNLAIKTFLSWNPAVGQVCEYLQTRYYVCVATVGWKPPTKTTTKPSNGVSTPTPIQSGMVGNCKKFHPVASTTTCTSIQAYYKITMAQLVKWNPAIGSKCTGLWANYYVCVGV